ncbi:MAG: hypothetical protein AB7T01_11035 [Acidithiobacillus sp.]
MLSPNTYVCPVVLEPVAGALDRFVVGALVQESSAGAIDARRIIRDDSLRTVYGKKGSGLANLVDHGLSALLAAAQVKESIQELPRGIMGLAPGPVRHIYASSVSDAFRTCVLMYSSIGNLEQWSEEETEIVAAEDGNQRFLTEVRDIAVSHNPSLRDFFNRKLPLRDGGMPYRFGFYNTRALLHFGILSANRQPASVKDAQAKLWQLKGGKAYGHAQHAALIFGVPRLDDPTFSANMVLSIQNNILEIERQADDAEMRFYPVNSAAEGAEKVLRLAS